MSLLDGRTAVVTGGAQGIGFAIAERYVAEGARVVLGDLDLGASEAAVERLGGRDVARRSGATSPTPPRSTRSSRRGSSSAAWT